MLELTEVTGSSNHLTLLSESDFTALVQSLSASVKEHIRIVVRSHEKGGYVLLLRIGPNTIAAGLSCERDQKILRNFADLEACVRVALAISPTARVFFE